MIGYDNRVFVRAYMKNSDSSPYAIIMKDGNLEIKIFIKIQKLFKTYITFCYIYITLDLYTYDHLFKKNINSNYG